jgi:hypothetical protein
MRVYCEKYRPRPYILYMVLYTYTLYIMSDGQLNITTVLQGRWRRKVCIHKITVSILFSWKRRVHYTADVRRNHLHNIIICACLYTRLYIHIAYIAVRNGCVSVSFPLRILRNSKCVLSSCTVPHPAGAHCSLYPEHYPDDVRTATPRGPRNVRSWRSVIAVGSARDVRQRSYIVRSRAEMKWSVPDTAARSET